MCGIFGFIGKKPNLHLLEEIAGLASTRGVHGWGIAGEKRFVKGKGKLEDHLHVLYDFGEEPFIIGHCRLATFGNYNGVVQPLRSERHTFAHNGNVYNYQYLANYIHYTMKTDCDSEVIGALLDVGYSLRKVSQLLNQPYAILATTKKGMSAIRKGLPLFVSEREEGTYFCSRAFDRSEPLKEGKEYSYS
ncbi:hypothetical protein [Priestia megaterium]|uniref:class II glutamine amidotransferase n=1 Tax=Priestia megaterium TaxID=1404 RepID=UPI002E1C01E4|nr:hypothetical protein [Priestia megaterium]